MHVYKETIECKSVNIQIKERWDMRNDTSHWILAGLDGVSGEQHRSVVKAVIT